MIRIFKFGGASVKDANGVRNASKIIQNQGKENNLVVVVSAMGKTTNALEILFEKAWNAENYEKEFNELKQLHETIVTDLFGIEDVDSRDALSRYFTRLEFQLIHSKGIEYDLGYDQIVTFGEYLSTLILSLYLRKKCVNVSLQNARFLIHTDMTWREGLVQMDETISSIRKNLEPLLKKGIVVTQGFIGGAKNGLLTT